MRNKNLIILLMTFMMIDNEMLLVIIWRRVYGDGVFVVMHHRGREDRQIDVALIAILMNLIRLKRVITLGYDILNELHFRIAIFLTHIFALDIIFTRQFSF